MNILLTAINAKYIHSNLAVYSLRACAGEYRDAVELAEYTINNQKDYILEELYKRKPDVLCFSCYIWNIDYVTDIAREYKKLCPSVPIWVGGPEVSYEVEAFLRENPYIDGVMIGEGEDTFRELCGYYAHQKRLIDIAGIAFRKNSTGNSTSVNNIGGNKAGEIVFTSPRPIKNMSEIPFCYDTLDDFSNRIIYYESSRGCPFSCSYCLSSVDKTLRFRDTEIVKRELKFFIDQKVPQIKFVDRTFNCNHAHAMELWRFIKANDNGVTNFHFEISADLLNQEELELISDMRPGLIQLEIGVQSTNEVTIKEIHRTMKLERLKEVVRLIQSGNNIHEHLDLIAGLPYEDYDSFGRSFDEIYELKPNQLQLGFLKVLKGSYMFEHAAEYGIVYHDKPPYEVMSTKWLSFDDVIKIKRVEEMLEVYYNSGQFEITMKLMECIFDSAFQFFQELGDFYEANGYFGMSHSRIRRCEILLEFLALYLHGRDSDDMTSVGLSEHAGDRDNTDFDENAQIYSMIQELGDFYEANGYFGMSHSRIRRCEILLEFLALYLHGRDSDDMTSVGLSEHAGDRDNTDFDENAQIYSMIQESLIFDLYYRENCKSRPGWATDVGKFKHMTHAYCKNGKLSHVEPFHYIFPDKHTRRLEKLPKYNKEPVWALFHYDMRDPLDHQAMVEYVE